MVKNKKGNIGILLLGVFMFFVLSMTSMIMLEYKTLSIKRQNIHNAVVAANLACYYSIEQGNKSTVLNYNPTELKNYLDNPDNIVTNKIPLENMVNMMTSEYFNKGERYKSIYLNGNTTYNYFSNYLEKNLGLKKDQLNSYIFKPVNSSDNKGDIVELKINNFEIYNAIYSDMTKISISNTLKNEKRTYTGIHLDLNAKINKDVKTSSSVKYANVPIHIDTEVTLFRPKIN